jgi:hypothetical protein
MKIFLEIIAYLSVISLILTFIFLALTIINQSDTYLLLTIYYYLGTIIGAIIVTILDKDE